MIIVSERKVEKIIFLEKPAIDKSFTARAVK